MDDAVITLDHVVFSYPGADFTIQLTAHAVPGQVVGIVGPNGSGKSTALKLMAGLYTPQQGTIRVGGHPLHTLSAKKRARYVSYMPQNPIVNGMTVEQFVLCGRYAHKRMLQTVDAHDNELAQHALRTVHMDTLAHQSLPALSGGQYQKAHIALMLAQQSDIMLLDEPLSALDVSACHDIMQLLVRVAHDHGVCMMVVIHDVDLALRYCDRIMIMQEGQITLDGPPADVVPSGVLERVFGVRVDTHESSHGTGYVFYPQLPHDTNQAE